MQRGLAGEIIGRLERRGLRIAATKLIHITRPLAEQHYAEHKGKGFYDGLVDYITSCPVVAAVFEGTNAVSVVRATIGATDPAAAAPGTIRADFGLERGRNLVHASDSPASAVREIELFFKPAEVVDWSRDTDRWIFE
ncbi:MAG: nucleoside-diphosphate kinase [Chloroflexi bacterium]|nr:nucleoside-diphosphate kinase [Chloroflexota bacterium]NJD66529.1 nucleoside-diphosphate kinase [Chloroflexota bacterium]PWB48402.1 MAG: nucleoside-diphosphate kinase [Dehalococcoidia bacterium]